MVEFKKQGVKKALCKKTLAALLILLCLGIVFYMGLQLDARRLPSPLIGKPFPDFILTDNQGHEIRKEQLLGKPFVLHIFASWCSTCAQEFSELNTFIEQSQLPWVGMFYKDKHEDALNFLAAYNPQFEKVIEDPKGLLALELGVYGVPETFLVDEAGVIKAKWAGDINERTIHHVLNH